MRFAAGPKMTDFLSDKPDIVGLGTLGLDAASSERKSNIFSEAKIHGAGLNSMEIVQSAAHQARGIEASGQAQAAATRASGMSNMIGSIAGGIGGMDFGGGGSSITPSQSSAAGWSMGSHLAGLMK